MATDPVPAATRPFNPVLPDRRREPFELRPGGQRMLTPRECALFLRADINYVYKLIRSGVLPVRRLTPRKTLVCESDLYFLLHRRT